MRCNDLVPRPGRIGEVAVPSALPAHRRSGPLQPVELAQAAVLAALCAATAIISVVVPFAAGLALLGTVPTGLLALRYRLRVLIAATVAAGMIAFLIAGGRLWSWAPCGYTDCGFFDQDEEASVLTPPSTVRALRHYCPGLYCAGVP